MATTISGSSEYDPASGTARFDAHLWFTNDGAITYAFHAEHRLWATLIQFAGSVAPSSATLTNVVATANGVAATKEFTL